MIIRKIADCDNILSITFWILGHCMCLFKEGENPIKKSRRRRRRREEIAEQRRGEEIAADKSLYFPPTNLEWGETLSMENIHEALSHSHSQSSAQSHFCSISFWRLSHMRDITFKEYTMIDLSHANATYSTSFRAYIVHQHLQNFHNPMSFVQK